MTINQNLRQLRQESGMTQAQVAERLGVTRQALSNYESGRTRPDIDTLMRLCEIYETDLDGILYGESRVLKETRRLRRTAAASWGIIAVLTLARSALLWYMNHFFLLPQGEMTEEKMALWEIRRQLISAGELLEGLILTVTLLGGLLLLFFLFHGTCHVAVRQMAAYAGSLAAAVLLIPLPFAAMDPLYAAADYLITPAHVVFRVLIFLAASMIAKRRKR